MRFSLLATGLLTAMAYAAPLVERADGDKLVFAHFMMGTQAARTSSKDYDLDMSTAKKAGIDAMALNIGLDSYTETQLSFAYQSAADNGIKVFISFDYNYYQTGSEAAVARLIKKYGGLPAQLKVENKVFVSTFNGNQEPAKTLNAPALKQAAGDIYLVPNFMPKGSTEGIDGAFNWMAWPNNGANRAPTPAVNLTVENGDTDYKNWLGSKPYMAPVSPWFFTDFDKYDKHWVFPGDLLWFNRWNSILALAPRFVEIITWNDYGEAHNIADLPAGSTVDGAEWSAGMPHSGWLEMALPYITAFKKGAKTPTIDEEKLVYWFRTSKVADFPKAIEGKESLRDSVFVVALLKSAGTVSVTTGSTTKTFEAKAGASAFEVPMGYGKQTFRLSRSGQDVFSATAAKEITTKGTNLNAFVGVAKSAAGAAVKAKGAKVI
ncbi:glycoside hydrolase family 71 protein [Periconia macrospinosa]|uniref:Glycoside hydrolase family 71 protein n=1 Tax=Periconia macrospinosa TaxID=97972 RepID=A0A2V1DUN0_9PLEO|nr:glycoside hydrolase family 71 protein [Periconia macrospinosa]